MVQPGSVILVWIMQWATLISSIAVAISVAILKGYIQQAKNKALWEDDNGKTPFTVRGDKVTLTSMQNNWFMAAYMFIALGLVPLLGFVHACMVNRRLGTAWGEWGARSGKKFLAQAVFALIGLVLGLVWIIFGFASPSVKVLNGKILPGKGDMGSAPVVTMTCIIVWGVVSVLYSVTVTVFYWLKKKHLKMYGEEYAE